MEDKDIDKVNCTIINKLLKLKQPVVITYRKHDDVYHCPSTTADEAYSVELSSEDDFDLIFVNQYVSVSDIKFSYLINIESI